VQTSYRLTDELSVSETAFVGCLNQLKYIDMNTVQDFLLKLDNVLWTSADRDVLTGTYNHIVGAGIHKIDVELSYRLKLSTFKVENGHMPIGCTIYLKMDGEQVAFWGIEDNEQLGEFVNWFNVRESLAYQNERKVRDLTERHAKTIYKDM
tara:strand:- start:2431 stop:2883 length:453 start_codon:yes stop_codon:yes gene_type:complete